MRKQITLQELKEYALAHSHEMFNIRNRFTCLACSMIQEKDNCSTVWKNPSDETIDGEKSIIVTPKCTYEVPPQYGIWCMSNFNWYVSGKDIADKIDEMMQVTP